LPTKLSPEQWESLAQKRRIGVSIPDLAKEYNLSPLYLKKRLQLCGIHIEVPESTKPRYAYPPRFPSDCLILCDSHIPYHDAKFINQVFALAQSWGIKNLLLAGDVVDIAALSVFAHRPEATLKKELSDLESFFRVVDEMFDKVLMLLGNHERRFLHFLKEELRAEHILKLVGEKKAVISEYSYAFVENWLVGHPRNVSVIPGRVPVFLSRKYPKYNVASGHGHLAGMAYCEDGVRLAVDIGCSCDEKRLDWIAEHLQTRGAMAQGALILRKIDSTIYPWWLHPKTDWEALARCYG